LVDAYDREHAAAQSLRELDEMKNTFLSAVSHDLRTPLTSVLGIARTLEVQGARLSHEERRDLSSRITKGAERLEGMLLDLLDVDRLTRGILEAKRVPIRIDTLVTRTVESLEIRDRRVEFDCDVVTFPVDAGQVERIVENLVINAARHGGPNTPIKVRVRNEVTSVCFEVEDGGPGVPDHLKEVIFEPFRQGDGPQVSGTGIGLSLVTEFAKLHGGRVWVEDAPGGGALFKVLLHEPKGPATPRPKRAMGGAGRSALINRAPSGASTTRVE
jgi:K+-sensing histidine kinase KdpD